MRKAIFFTLTKDGLQMVHGYTDGTFAYYKNDLNHVWLAVAPSTGLSVCAGLTRAKAQQYAWEHMDDYNKLLKTTKYIALEQAFKDMIAKYEKK